MLNNKLSITDVFLGDLVFIVNHEKPIKTGWWRLIKEHRTNGSSEVVLVLEKPMHKDFDVKALIKSNSRVDNGVFRMSPSTIVHEQSNKYELMYVASGMAGAKLVTNNYIPPINFFNTSSSYFNDFVCTDNGVELYGLWQDDSNELRKLAQNLLK